MFSSWFESICNSFTKYFYNEPIIVEAPENPIQKYVDYQKGDLKIDLIEALPIVSFEKMVNHDPINDVPIQDKTPIVEYLNTLEKK